MATIESLDPKDRAFVSMYKWHENDPVPWATMRVPLAQARVGLVVMACMTLPDQPPFHADRPENDASLRVIPRETDPRELVNTFPEQGFDHAGLQADPNLLIPLDRMQQLHVNGEIGELAPHVASLCGHLPKPDALIAATAPEIARLFDADGVDAALLVPA